MILVTGPVRDSSVFFMPEDSAREKKKVGLVIRNGPSENWTNILLRGFGLGRGESGYSADAFSGFRGRETGSPSTSQSRPRSPAHDRLSNNGPRFVFPGLDENIIAKGPGAN